MNTNHENEPRANDLEAFASQGTLEDRYAIYAALSEDMQEEVVTFDEWLNS